MSTDMYALPYIPVWRGASLGTFRAKATGCTTWRYLAQKLMRQEQWQVGCYVEYAGWVFA